MMKYLFLSCFQIFSLILSAQEDVTKIMQSIAGDTSHNKYGNNLTAGNSYNIRGFKLYAEVYGKGAPLLFIHGNSGSISDFSLQIPHFKERYKVIVADSRANGKSKDKSDSLSYEMMADDYAALLNQMKIDSAYVVGWSDGGIIGLLMAIRHPGKVKKLVITGANLWPDTTAVFGEIINLILPGYTALRQKLNKTPAEKSTWKLLRLLIEEPHISLADLQRINIPALVIGGDHDVIRPEHTLLIARNIRNSYLWIIPNSGHSTPLAYSQEFNRKIDDFLFKPYRSFSPEKRFY